MPGLKKKDLYLGKCLGDLHKASEVKQTCNNVTIFIKSSNKVFQDAEVYDKQGDEERAYVMYMRYFNILKQVKSKADYKKQKEYFDKLIGSKNQLTAIERAEELSESLKNRYDLKEAEAVAKKLSSLDTNGPARSSSDKKDKEDVPVTDTPPELPAPVAVPPAPPAGTIQCRNLCELLRDSNTKLILMDVRPSADFNQSHISHTECISVPEEIVTPGSTVNHIQAKLPSESQDNWLQRGHADHIILLDWRSRLDQVIIGSPLRTLKDALFKFDMSTIIKSEPLVLEGGYEQWLLFYPTMTTNPHVSRPSDANQAQPPSPTMTLDFDYPDFEENGLVATQQGPASNTSDAMSTPLSAFPVPSMPQVDRSLKPTWRGGTGGGSTLSSSGSLVSNETTSSRLNNSKPTSATIVIGKDENVSVYPSIISNETPTKHKNTNLLNNQTASGPKSINLSVKNELASDFSESVAQREKREEELLEFQRARDKSMKEDRQRLEDTEKQLRDLEQMKKREEKDVADLMRMKRKLKEEVEEEKRRQGEERRRLAEEEEMRLAALEQAREEEEKKKQRMQDVDRLRQDRKKRHEEEEERKREEAELHRRRLEEEEEEEREWERKNVERVRKERENEEVLLAKQNEQAELQRKQEEERVAEEKRKQEEQIEKDENERLKKQQELVEKQRKEAEEAVRLQQERDAKRVQQEREDAARREQERIAREKIEKENERKRKEELEKKRLIEAAAKEKEEREKAVHEQAAREKAERERVAEQMRAEQEKLRRLKAEQTPSKVVPSPMLPSGWEKRLDRDTNRYYYIDHNRGVTQWVPPATATPATGIVKQRLKDEPSVSSSRGLSRSHSSPNIKKQLEEEEAQERARAVLPSVDRGSKPTRVVTLPKQVAYSVRKRDLNPVYGNVGPALTGLRNLGNTCYMNSTIQCLNNTSPLVSYFLNDSYLHDINRESSQGMHGEVVDDFAVVIKALWSEQYRSITPRDLKNTVGQYNPMFAGYQQQDSQEFLTFLLDGLHEGLNEVRKAPDIPEQDNDKLADVEAARIAWKHHKLLHRSIIVELFQGQLKSTLMCRTCRKQSVNFQAFMFLSLPIPASTRCSFRDCMQEFLKPELMTGSSRWKCPRCKVERDSEKKIDIWKVPPILLVGLNRFYSDGMWMQKKTTYVDFPVTDLDFSPYIIGPTPRNRYNLYGISNHYGTMEGGHYTAFCRNPGNKKWYKFDDQDVYEISKSDVKTSAAFVLYYTSIDMPTPHFVPRL